MLKQLVTDGPTEDELNRTIVRSVVDLELLPTVPEAISHRLAWAHLCDKPLSLTKERETLEGVTVTQVGDLCKRVIRSSNAALAVLGPAAKDLEKRLRKAIQQGLLCFGTLFYPEKVTYA